MKYADLALLMASCRKRLAEHETGLARAERELREAEGTLGRKYDLGTPEHNKWGRGARVVVVVEVGVLDDQPPISTYLQICDGTDLGRVLCTPTLAHLRPEQLRWCAEIRSRIESWVAGVGVLPASCRWGV